ncbi:uncharacterized protein LOC117102171, partial [Anneissia japonica]|uniref:uncharacterized protein LOC117102171 n=1 Tax=Anneissia japonica TaxID=1529436 RepID=UPI001425B825
MFNMASTSAALVLVLALSALSYSQTPTETAAKEFRESFRRVLDMKVQEYKRDLSKAMRSRMRYKRNLDDQLSTTQWIIVENDSDDPYIEGILKFFSLKGSYYFLDLYGYASISPITVSENGNVHIDDELAAYDMSFPSDVDIIPYNDTAVFLLTANYRFQTVASELTYTGLSTVHLWEGKAIAPELLFSFLTNGASAVDSITFHDTLIFGVANMRSDLNVKYRNDIRIYEWKDSYFDEILIYETHGASDLEFFKIGEELYLAVTQFIDDEFNYAVGSKILKIDLYAPAISLIQIIPTTAPRSVTMYKLDHDVFLAFTNNIVENSEIQNEVTDSVVYWWTGELFLEYQRIQTSGAKDIKYTHLLNGDDLLLVANVDPSLGVVIYECDDEGDWAISEQQFPQWNNNSQLGPIVDEMSVFELDGNAYASFTYKPNSTHTSGFTNFYQFSFVNKSEDITYATHPILSSIPELKDSITENIERLGELFQELKKKVRLSENETIYSDVRFNANITFENKLYVENFTADYYELESLVQLRKKLDQHGTKIQYIEDVISDFVSLSTEDQYVTGNITFISPLNITNLNVSDAVTSTDEVINDVNIAHLDDFSIKTNQNTTINGNITFIQTVTVGGDVNAVQFTNGYHVPDDYLLTTNTSQVHTGNLTFDDNVYVDSNLSLNGTVNGIYIPNSLVLSSIENLHITGNKSFWGNVTVLGDIKIASNITMNEIELLEFINSVYLTTDDIELYDNVHFQEEVSFQNLTILNEYIDTTNISKFRQIVKTYGEVIIGATQNLLNTIQVDGDIFLSNKLNGIDISEDLVLTTGDQVVYSNIFIKNDVIFKGNVTVNETLNNVRPEHFLLLDEDQEITGTINFANGFYVDGDITLANGSTINGIDLGELYKRVVMIDENAEITAKKYFVDTLTFSSSLTVEGLINGVNITTLNEEALYVTDNITFTSDVNFKGDIHVLGGVSLEGTIDNRRLEDFVALKTPQNITGIMSFNDSVHINGSLTFDDGITIDEVDLSEFSANVLKNNGNQTLFGNLEIIGNVTVNNNMHVNGTVNGFDISEDFVTLHGEQILY